MPKEKLTITHHVVVLTRIIFLYTETVNNCSSCLHPDLYNQYTKKMRNKQKHFNVTVANQFTVQETSYEKKFFFKRKMRGKTPNTNRCFPNISPSSKNLGPCCSTKKGQSSKSNSDNNAKQF